jgi:hypothetical protein
MTAKRRKARMRRAAKGAGRGIETVRAAEIEFFG